MLAFELVDIAKGEIGYKEKKSNAHLDEKTANAGSGNYTKYARDLNTAGFFNGNKNGYDWCTTFVVWCAWVASGKIKKDTSDLLCFAGDLAASCKYATNYYKKAGRFYTDPEVGDQAFFARGHTGIVENVTKNKVTLIEGNCNNEVKRMTYTIPNAQFTGFGRPRYEKIIEAPEKPSPIAVYATHTVVPGDTPERIARKYGTTWQALIAANIEKYPKITRDFIRDGWVLTVPVLTKEPEAMNYEARVTPTNGLNVREGAGTKYGKRGVLTYHTKITVREESEGWGRIDYKGAPGWVALGYVEKV